ncbi:MAG: globin [Phycisphaeraceae bacterium]|nr:globin [Phycisphaeraceae bacterium]
MELQITDYPMGERPMVALPDPAFLEHLGEAGIRDLVGNHYDALVNSPIKDLFPSDTKMLAMAKKHSADFFIQICGGPDYFIQSRGQPKMAKRHAPFKITPQARATWLACYKPILSELELPEEMVQSFWNYLNIFSVWMINTPDETTGK